MAFILSNVEHLYANDPPSFIRGLAPVLFLGFIFLFIIGSQPIRNSSLNGFSKVLALLVYFVGGALMSFLVLYIGGLFISCSVFGHCQSWH